MHKKISPLSDESSEIKSTAGTSNEPNLPVNNYLKSSPEHGIMLNVFALNNISGNFLKTGATSVDSANLLGVLLRAGVWSK